MICFQNKKTIILTAILVALLLVGCNQQLSNLIVQVKDQSGQIVNTKVEITREGKTRIKKTKQGVAQFKELPTGKYQLKVAKKGYYSINESIALKEKDLNYDVKLEKKLFDLTINITNESGKNIAAQINIKNNSIAKLKSLTPQNNQIKDLAPGEYSLTISKDGYKNVTKTITIKNKNSSHNIKLEKKKIKKTEPKTIQQLNLNINVIDNNKNPLKAEIKLKQNAQVTAKKNGKTALFKNLSSGEYLINITHPNYNKWSKKVTLKNKNKKITAKLTGGPIKQYVIDNNSTETIKIDDLNNKQEAIIALAYMNWDNIPEEKIYPVRQKGNKLVQNYGTQFANTTINYSVGDTKKFRVPKKVNEKDTLTANLAKAGKHVYIFTDENMTIKDEKLNRLISEFDTKIYPNLTNESIKSKTVILLSDFDNYKMTGYFDPSDLYPGLGNEMPMFYLNANRTTNTILTAAAHQYQHLNFFVTKAKVNRVSNDAWINQGLAQLAPQLLGYINPEQRGWSKTKGNGWVYDKSYGYLNNTPQINLLVQDGSLAFMGGTTLFTNYLVDHYGAEIVPKIMSSSQAPIKTIENYTGKSFNNIYLNWITTNVTDNINEIDNKIYNYPEFNLNQMPNLNNKETNTAGVNYFKLFKATKITVNGTKSDNAININTPTDFTGQLGIVVIKK